MEKNTDKKLKRVIVSGGGTGGHIFPAVSIANALKRRFPDIDILFVGAEGRMEMERVPAAGYPIKGLPVAGFDRKRLWRNASVLMKLWRSIRMARKIVADFKPDVVVGVGGYASGPTLKAAQKMGIPTLLQEQNSYAGVTNKLLAKEAAAICTAYENMDRFFPAEKIYLTGNPVRAALLECGLSQSEAKKALGFDPAKPLVFITGGSLGAGSINRAVGASLAEIADSGSVSVLWQTGRYGHDEAVKAAKAWSTVHVEKFISQMDVAYRAADLVVARAGAGTISELQLLGKAAVLVPSPNVAENHQYKNALALSSRDAAVLVEDATVATELAPTVKALINDPERLATLSRNCAAMALHNSDERIVDHIVELINKK